LQGFCGSVSAQKRFRFSAKAVPFQRKSGSVSAQKRFRFSARKLGYPQAEKGEKGKISGKEKIKQNNAMYAKKVHNGFVLNNPQRGALWIGKS